MMVVLGEEEHSGSIHYWLTAYFATVELLKENVKIRKIEKTEDKSLDKNNRCKKNKQVLVPENKHFKCSVPHFAEQNLSYTL